MSTPNESIVFDVLRGYGIAAPRSIAEEIVQALAQHEAARHLGKGNEPEFPRHLMSGEAMDVEHQVWMEACRRIHELTGEDVNDPQWNGVIDAFRYWGETLHQLRLADPSHDTKALAEAKQLFEQGR